MKIIQDSTKNQSSRNGTVPELLVCHIADGYEPGVMEWEKNPSSQVSSHFIIDRDGTVHQMVPLNMKAWTQGLHPGDIKNAKLDLVKKKGTADVNLYCYSIEHEGMYKDTHGALTDAQLAASVEVVKFIAAEHKRLYGKDFPIDRAHIVGHYEINPINKPNCPGEKFPFDKLIAAVKASKASVPSPAPAAKPAAPTYPLAAGQFFGPEGGGINSISGYHSHRDDLKRFQQRMRDRGWNITVDGLYGQMGDKTPEGNTADITKQFQAEKGLKSNALIDRQTWDAAWKEPVTK